MRTLEVDIGTRTIRGFIHANGTILNGTGFTVTKTGTGTYVVRPTIPFRGTPEAVATAGQSLTSVAIGTVTATDVQFITVTTGAADVYFHFVISGR